MITFEQFYLNENLYLDKHGEDEFVTGKITDTPLTKEIFQITNVSGANSATFKDSKMFVGYITQNENTAGSNNSENKKKLYFYLKGIGQVRKQNVYTRKNKTFANDDLGSQDNAYYLEFIKKAITNFDKQAQEKKLTYNLVAFSESRSSHINDIIKYLKQTKTCANAWFMPSVKKYTLGTSENKNGAANPLLAKDNKGNLILRKEYDLTNFINKYIEHLITPPIASKSQLKNPIAYIQLNDAQKQLIGTTIKKYFINYATWHDHEPMSTASHTRIPTFTSNMNKKVLAALENSNSGLDQESLSKVKERLDAMSRANKNLPSHHDLTYLTNTIADKLQKQNVNLLIVDDNINSGDQFYQFNSIFDLVNKSVNEKNIITNNKFAVDWFFLCMSQKYASKKLVPYESNEYSSKNVTNILKDMPFEKPQVLENIANDNTFRVQTKTAARQNNCYFVYYQKRRKNTKLSNRPFFVYKTNNPELAKQYRNLMLGQFDYPSLDLWKGDIFIVGPKNI